MKKIIYAIIVPLIILFTSCQSIAHKYEYFDSNCGIDAVSEDGDCYQINSKEEKNVFLNYYELNIQFLRLLNKYDENYFSTMYIVILVMPTSSSSLQYKLKNLHINEKIEFEIKMKKKKYMAEDLVNKAFIVELPKDLSDKNCKISLVV